MTSRDSHFLSQLKMVPEPEGHSVSPGQCDKCDMAPENRILPESGI